MEKQTKARRQYDAYIEGTAVRKTSPQVQQPAVPRTYVGDERVAVSKSVYRNREKALQMSLSYVMVLGVCAVALFLIFVQYISLQDSITSRKEHIISLEMQTSNLKEKNDTFYHSFNSCLDIENITRIATEELGMIRATEEQVQFYESSEYEYMKQFKDVPTGN